MAAKRKLEIVDETFSPPDSNAIALRECEDENGNEPKPKCARIYSEQQDLLDAEDAKQNATRFSPDTRDFVQSLGLGVDSCISEISSSGIDELHSVIAELVDHLVNATDSKDKSLNLNEKNNSIDLRVDESGYDTQLENDFTYFNFSSNNGLNTSHFTFNNVDSEKLTKQEMHTHNKITNETNVYHWKSTDSLQTLNAVVENAKSTVQDTCSNVCNAEVNLDVDAEGSYIDNDSMGSEVDVVGTDSDEHTVPGGQKYASKANDCTTMHQMPAVNDDSSNSSSNSSLNSDISQEAPTTSSSIAGNGSADSSETDNETSETLRHLRGALKKPGIKRNKKSVNFTNVTVYYFPRSQGFTCVPSQGGSTLGMDYRHCHIKCFSLDDHAEEKKQVHRNILMRQKKFAKQYQKHHSTSTSESDEDSNEDVSDISDSELEMDSCYFLQPVPIRQRRALLRASGVRKIESLEKEECRDIRASREYCGCECRIYCDPETCQCSLAGIKCQVDRLSFPCGCTRDGCGNLNGRVEFNPLRVRTHFIHTLMRLELERKSEQQLEFQSLSSGDSSDSCSNAVSSSCTSNSHYIQTSTSDSFANSNSLISSGESFLSSLSGNTSNASLTSGCSTSVNTNVLNCSSTANVHNNNSDIYGSPFSPDDSSYSENSDCTSDEYDSDTLSANKPAIKVCTNHKPSISNLGPHSTQGTLPPFPSLSAETSSVPPANGSTINGTEFANSQHYSSHQTGHFIGVAAASARDLSSHLNVSSSQSAVSYVPNYNYHELYNNQYISPSQQSSAHEDCSAVTTSNMQSPASTMDDDHHYTDLSQSIASSKSVENISGLLSAANIVKDLRLINPLTVLPQSPISIHASETNEMRVNLNANDNVGKQMMNEMNRNRHQSTNSECCVDQHESSTRQEQQQTSLNQQQAHEELSENFGEIIKKTMVETVTA
ncbi:Cysteine/serine-rich nuclear protein 3-like protein [Dinothrombium tinctorium]|uniref:Cysteine/serine-rich nuclear protein 3-like protein n=1 Tax=Dinothrombium tinctorium TaxID=1965070 RepID=A0A443RIB6_9ACAR|nr:Cysteine/serine-rich nuclear protein 3-like protein [Dinothrombium tinctorium]